MKYIEKQEVIEAVKAHSGSSQTQESTPHLMLKDEIKYIVDDMPAADVAQVVHGKWEKISEPDEDGNVWYRCPICLHNDKQSPGIEVPYCWYCGAKMDLEAQHE